MLYISQVDLLEECKTLNGCNVSEEKITNVKMKN